MSLTHHDDKVWFDEATKLEQICNEVAASKSNQQTLLLLSHFDATVDRLASMLTDRSIRYERFSFSATPGKVGLGSTRTFQTGLSSSAALKIIVAEHHPLASRDQAVVDAAAKLSSETELCFHFSLDDPVMRHFGAETVKALFEALGIEKNECISHHLVTTAIRAAQQKIEEEVGKDVPTHSAEDWLKYNLPNSRQS